MNDKRTYLRTNVLAPFNVIPIVCQLIGGVAAVSLGFGLNLDKTHSFSDLMMPVYVSFVFVLLIRVARDSLKKQVTVLMQYDTEVGLEAKDGKEFQLRAYKAVLALQSLYIGLFLGWTLVLLSTKFQG